MRLQDLKPGMVVFYRSGESRKVVLKEGCIMLACRNSDVVTNTLRTYNPDMSNGLKSLDIMQVWKGWHKLYSRADSVYNTLPRLVRRSYDEE